MNDSLNRYKVDALISQFWQNGYLTISRKYGKYLPEPEPIGRYNVDAVAKYKEKLAIGITLNEEDFNSDRLLSKIEYLVNVNPKYSGNKVKLFIGVNGELYYKAIQLLSDLSEETKKRIKIVRVKNPLN